MSAQAVSGEVQSVLAGILARNAGVVPTRDMRLQGDLGLDSLSLIDLAVEAEEAFGIRIPDEDLERFATVGDLADYLRQTMTRR